MTEAVAQTPVSQAFSDRLPGSALEVTPVRPASAARSIAAKLVRIADDRAEEALGARPRRRSAVRAGGLVAAFHLVSASVASSARR